MRRVLLILYMACLSFFSLEALMSKRAMVAQLNEDFKQVLFKSKKPHSKKVKKEAFRSYKKDDSVAAFYKENHEKQSFAFVLKKKEEYLPLKGAKLGIWEVVEALDEIVDESDPDLSLPQSYHAFQTAEAIRRDGHPRWLVLVGFIHDLGKILSSWGELQWAVVGDTFPVGCKFSEKIIYRDFFKANPDISNEKFNTLLGVYKRGCGFDEVHFSWGHDEYLYQVVKDYLPEEASYVIRYHSFYAAHKEGEYNYLMSNKDKELMQYVKLFNQYDLYSKEQYATNYDEMKPYYKELVAEFFPEKVQW